jgi:hypothetical protein
LYKYSHGYIFVINQLSALDKPLSASRTDSIRRIIDKLTFTEVYLPFAPFLACFGWGDAGDASFVVAAVVVAAEIAALGGDALLSALPLPFPFDFGSATVSVVAAVAVVDDDDEGGEVAFFSSLPFCLTSYHTHMPRIKNTFDM